MLKNRMTPFKFVLAFYALTGAILVPFFLGQPLPPFLPHSWHKLLHLLGAILFLGNVTVSGFWSVALLRQGSQEMTRAAVRILCWADVFFTAPGFFLLVLNGVAMSRAFGGLQAGWLKASLLMLGLMGVLAVYVFKLQIDLWRLCASPEPLPEQFSRLMKQWGLWGTLTLFPTLAILILMVLKPAF